MSKSTDDCSSKTNGTNSMISSWGSRIGQFGILSQGLVIFLGLSVLLGRIYFLKYFDTLGIPLSDVSVHILDYAVMSPDVTILGVGLAVVWPAILLTMRPNNQQQPKWGRLIMGLVLASIGIGFSLLPRLTGSEAEIGFGEFGLRRLLSLVFSLAGGAFVGAGIADSGLLALPTESSDRIGTRTTIRMYRPFMFILLLVFGVSMTASLSAEIAELDAERTLLEAPMTNIALNSAGKSRTNWSYFGDFDRTPNLRRLALVHVGDTFVYFRHDGTSNGTSNSSGTKLLAVSLEDIRFIDYMDGSSK